MFVSLVLMLPLALVISVMYGLRSGWFEDREHGAPDGTLQSLPVISMSNAYARTVVLTFFLFKFKIKSNNFTRMRAIIE